MAELAPFRALRYDPDRVDLAKVVCPPYDVISPQLRAQLLERDPFNVVRIELPVPEAQDTQPTDPYERAAATRRLWQAEGVLRADPECLLIHRHGFEVGGLARVRTGVLGALRLEDRDQNQLLPHELTLSHARADRTRLLETVRANTSPVWGIFDDTGTSWAAALERLTQAAPDVDFVDGSERHQLWRITSPADLEPLVDSLASRQVVVADGNHRSGVALAYRNQRRTEAGGADPNASSEFMLTLLVGTSDPGLLVLPTHRLVAPAPGQPDLGQMSQALELNFEVRKVDGLGGIEALQAADPSRNWVGALHRQGGLAFSLRRPDGRLDVEQLGELVLGPVLGIGAAEVESGALGYTRSHLEAEVAVREGKAAFAFITNPVSLPGLIKRATEGRLMPPKTTYFWPKPPTGLAFHDLG